MNAKKEFATIKGQFFRIRKCFRIKFIVSPGVFGFTSEIQSNISIKRPSHSLLNGHF